MTVQPFELLEPRTLPEALELLREDPDLRPLGGGTALVILMKQGLLRPERLANLKKIRGLDTISWDDDGTLRVGALASIGSLERDETIRSRLPGLSDACHVVANVRIRNLATIGGNLAHGDYQSDPPAALTALDARVRISSARAEREEPIETFQVSGYETTLQPGELVTGVIVPPLPAGTRTTYLKFTSRSAEDRPCAGIAVRYRGTGAVCEDLRVVVGAVSSTPVRVPAAESLAPGQRITHELAVAIGEAASAAVQPTDDIRGSVAYKRHLVGVLVRRAVLDISGAAA
jgi:carbon-monoxide dehydrogenase medium subunit